MCSQKNATVKLQKIIDDMYSTFKDEKTMPAAKRDYCSGYADALITLEMISADEFKQLLEDRCQAIFGMSLQQRRMEFDVVHEPELLDAPAWRRKGVVVSW